MALGESRRRVGMVSGLVHRSPDIGHRRLGGPPALAEWLRRCQEVSRRKPGAQGGGRRSAR